MTEQLPPGTENVTYVTAEELAAIEAEEEQDLSDFIEAIRRARS